MVVDNNAVFNVVLKAVLPEQDAFDFLDIDEIGREIHQNFVKMRLPGDLSI